MWAAIISVTYGVKSVWECSGPCPRHLPFDFGFALQDRTIYDSGKG